MIAVKDAMKRIKQIKQDREEGQTLQIILNNWKKERKAGMIYAPQEGVTPDRELKQLYTSTSEEMKKAKAEDEQ